MSPRAPAGPTPAHLRGQLERLGEATRALTAGDAVDRSGARELHAALGDVAPTASRLAARGILAPAERDACVSLALALQQELRAHAGDRQAATFARIQAVLPDAGSARSALELLDDAPRALCAACGLDRALVSRVEGSSWVAGTWRLADGTPDLAHASVDGMRIALRSGLVETEVVRRRTPSLVEPVVAGAPAGPTARHHQEFAERSGLRGYVVAPVVADDRVIGLVHGTLDPGGRRLSSVDRDMTRLFADRFGRAYEGAVIAERVERLRERLRLALDPEDAGVTVLDPTVVRFARASSSVAALTPVRALSAMPEATTGDALTAREHEILALLATGATNLQIADQLVLSESTVKSHVKRILRKLPAANRAEAAYRYLRTATGQGDS